MKKIIPLLFVGLVVVVGAQQTAPPPPPTTQGPRSEVPTVHKPGTYAPTVHKPQTMTPETQVPQTYVPTVAVPQPAMPMGQVFEGTWSASGQRQILHTDSEWSAVTVQLSGALTITTGAGLSRGFRGEVIGFDDGAGLIAGRAVWTDEHNDRIFSGIYGDAITSSGNQMRGTITGGTGRYAGMTGEYEFRWQNLLTTEDNVVHGRAVDIRGRVRAGGSQ
jgi:hypothetical protein